LTLAYSLIFAASSAGALALVYLMTSAFLARETDAELRYLRDEMSSKFADMETEEFRRDIALEVAARGTSKISVRIISPEGRATFDSGGASWKALPAPAEVLRLAGQKIGGARTVTLDEAGSTARVICWPLSRGHALEVAVSDAEHDRFLHRLRWIAALTLCGMVVVGALTGWLMARRAMSGVAAVTGSAARIAGGELGGRVRVGGHGAEIDDLGATFNEMAERIEALVRGMREVTDSIAHDLRSPITRMRCNAEMPLLGDSGPEDYQEYAARTIEDCDRLLEIINTMLDISEFEAGAAPLALQGLDLVGLAREAVEIFEPAAESSGISLKLEAEGPVPVQVDSRRLQRAVGNLLDNALKYTPSGGEVRVAVRERGGTAELCVRDTGPGIPPADAERVFERFFRGDRSRPGAGSGLGLSLARAIARAHRGDVFVRSEEGRGSAFTISLPLSADKPGD
jgi:signal transduction histidine kinase